MAVTVGQGWQDKVYQAEKKRIVLRTGHFELYELTKMYVMQKIIGKVRLTTVLNTKSGKNDVYPVAVRVYHGGVRRYYNVEGILCKARSWRYFFTTRVEKRKAEAEKVKVFFNKVAKSVAFLVESEIFSFAVPLYPERLTFDQPCILRVCRALSIRSFIATTRQ